MFSSNSSDFVRRSRRLVLVALTWLVVAPATYAGPTGTEETGRQGKRPNVLFIVIDTLRADHLSTYGYERATSPNLDRIAEEGVVYENAYSSAPWTLPSHASMFTGLFPKDHNATAETLNLADGFDTLPERLKKAGYRTAGFSNNVWVNEASGFKQGFDVFEELYAEQKTRNEGISVDDLDADMGGKLTNREVLSWLDGKPTNDDRPFFVFINYFEPHMPYRPTRPFDKYFLPEGAKPGVVQRLRSFYSPREYGYILRLPFTEIPPAEMEILKSLYDAEIAYSDDNLNQLLEGLRERGVLDDTILVITSDHGEHLGENHMIDHKLSIYEPLLHVPLVLWNPGIFPKPLRIQHPVQNQDLFGTVLELTGVRHHAKTLPLTEPPTGDSNPTLTFAQMAFPTPFLEAIARKIPAGNTKPFERALTTVRGPRYKLIEGSDGSLELYDLTADPLESKNLATELPKVVEEMKSYIEQFRAGKLPPR